MELKIGSIFIAKDAKNVEECYRGSNKECYKKGTCSLLLKIKLISEEVVALTLYTKGKKETSVLHLYNVSNIFEIKE